jgi:hypothetical protein
MIELGDKVVDKITGFEDIVCARLTGLFEATQIRIHPCSLSATTEIKNSVWLEEARCEKAPGGERVCGFVGIYGKQ